MAPDLDDPAQRKAYRAELMRFGRGWRWLGITLNLAGLTLLAWPRMGGPWMLGRWSMQSWGWTLVALGFATFLGVIVARTRHHRRRIAEPSGL